MAQVRHNYKLRFGCMKSADPCDDPKMGLLSSHYDSLPMLIVDAKAYLKTYESVAVYLRGKDLKICTLDCDGGVEWHMNHQEYREAVADIKDFWNKRAEAYENSNEPGAEATAKERRYLAEVYPDLLMIEYRMLRTEFSK